MRVVLVGIGSHGDVAPHLNLGALLHARGHDVTVVGLAPYASRAAAVGVRYVAVDADTTAALWPANRLVRAAALVQPGLMYAAMLRQLARVAERVNATLLQVVDRGTLVVSGLVTAGACAVLGRRRGARVVPILFAPLLPADSPASSALAPSIGGAHAAHAGSSLMWQLSQRLAWAHTRDMAVRLDAEPSGSPLGSGPVLMATSPTVSPPSRWWPAGVRQTGWLAPPPADRHTPLSPALDAFLSTHPEPVLMTFGSCPVLNPQRDVRLFVAAATAAGRPLVLQTPAEPFGPLTPGVFNAPDVPHAALLPRVRAVVHHGGAGTTYAALAAGRPSVVVPHLGDQGYYARRVHELGAGPRGVPRWRLTGRQFTSLVEQACADDGRRTYRRGAATVAAQLAGEDGGGQAVHALEECSAA